MLIVNCRIGNDRELDKFTCRNASVVDYAISRPKLLKCFEDFYILESSKLYSDVHTPLHTAFNVEVMSKENIKTVANDKLKVKPLEDNKTHDFQSNIDIDKVCDFEQKLKKCS